jgi:hypothetical protein
MCRTRPDFGRLAVVSGFGQGHHHSLTVTVRDEPQKSAKTGQKPAIIGE